LVGFCKELFVAKKSARVVAHLKHLKIEGLCLNAMSVGRGGGVIVMVSLLLPFNIQQRIQHYDHFQNTARQLARCKMMVA
jgi:hypothetical protein